MALSDDLIAQFAKITKDKPERVKEATVYGNIVIQNDKKFVMIDGSNTLTPVVSTSEANEGERVTVMIKDHTATITGNITNPSSSTGTVDKLTEEYNDVDSRVTEMEDILSGDVDFADIKDAINSKADKSTVNALDKRVGDVESDVKDISDSVATIAGDLKDKAETKDVETLTGQMEEIYPMVKEHERILSEGGGPDEPETPSGPIHLSDDTATVENGFIKNDMIDSVDAGKLKSGTIDNSLVKIQDVQGILSINGGNLVIKDPNTGVILLELGLIASSHTKPIGWVMKTSDGEVIGNHQNGITKLGQQFAYGLTPCDIEGWTGSAYNDIKTLKEQVANLGGTTPPFNPDADTIYVEGYPEISGTWNYYPTYNEFFRYLDEQFKLMKQALNDYGIYW